MKNIKIKYFTGFTLILVLLSFIFSYNFFSTIKNNISNGWLDYVKVEQHTFNYSDSIGSDAYNELLFSNNGFIYKRKTPIGQQTFVFDYNWIDSGSLNDVEIKEYLENNRLLMLMRTMYLTQMPIIILIVSIILLIVTNILSPTLLYLFSEIFTYVRKRQLKDLENELKYLELYKSLLLTKVNRLFEQSRDYLIIIFIYSYFTLYLLDINSSIAQIVHLLPTILSVYVGILSIICLSKIIHIITTNEIKKLTRELLNKDLEQP